MAQDPPRHGLIPAVRAVLTQQNAHQGPRMGPHTAAATAVVNAQVGRVPSAAGSLTPATARASATAHVPGLRRSAAVAAPKPPRAPSAPASLAASPAGSNILVAVAAASGSRVAAAPPAAALDSNGAIPSQVGPQQTLRLSEEGAVAAASDDKRHPWSLAELKELGVICAKARGQNSSISWNQVSRELQEKGYPCRSERALKSKWEDKGGLKAAYTGWLGVKKQSGGRNWEDLSEKEKKEAMGTTIMLPDSLLDEMHGYLQSNYQFNPPVLETMGASTSRAVSAAAKRKSEDGSGYGNDGVKRRVFTSQEPRTTKENLGALAKAKKIEVESDNAYREQDMDLKKQLVQTEKESAASMNLFMMGLLCTMCGDKEGGLQAVKQFQQQKAPRVDEEEQRKRAEMQQELADKNQELADKNQELAELRAELHRARLAQAAAAAAPAAAAAAPVAAMGAVAMNMQAMQEAARMAAAAVAAATASARDAPSGNDPNGIVAATQPDVYSQMGPMSQLLFAQEDSQYQW